MTRWPTAGSSASSRSRVRPDHECIAVSTTSDATGTWNRYDFDLIPFGTNFYDYPNLGSLARCLLHGNERIQFIRHGLPRHAAVRFRPHENVNRPAGYRYQPGPRRFAGK